jgi:hypothetical protein
MIVEVVLRLIGAGVLAFFAYKVGEALGGPYNRYVYVPAWLWGYCSRLG